MYLSYLLIDVGANPDRPRPGRLWLRNVYRVHQRLCMAFPSRERKERDKDFLQPYNPSDFPPAHVHAPRSENTGFLFRVDPQPGASPMVIVQSASPPDWHYAFHNASHLLAAKPDTKEHNPRFESKQRLRFRLKANPTRRACHNSRDSKGQAIKPEWVGKRIPVPMDGHEDWLARHGERGGFHLVRLTSKLPGYVYFNKGGQAAAGQRLISVLYEGVLEVSDAEAFLKTLQTGIGPAKAFGFGLLSLAPLQVGNPAKGGGAKP